MKRRNKGRKIINSKRKNNMKKIILSLLGLVLMLGLVGVISASSSIYTAFVDQGIIYSPGKAYYPTVVYTGSQYLMLSDSAQSAISTDGLTWVNSAPVTGLTNPKHMVMLYDANGFGWNYDYKIWYFDSAAAVPSGTGSIRYAESNDGINWVNDQAVFGGNMTVYGDDNVNAPARTWGPGTVIYNPDAINTDDNPLDYSYVMYYDGYNGITDDLDWDNTEALFLAYSINGINWNRYTRSPVLKGGSVGEWDNGGVGYPTVMQIEDGSYVMWYGGGSGTNTGIGFTTSPDGISWTKDTENPMFHKSDITDPGGYRVERTYTPRVIDDGSGELKMYYSAKSDTGVYAVGLARLDSDNDGIPYSEDLCPGTIPDSPERLGINRWIWNGDGWETKSPKGEGPQKTFTMEDTQGCSCAQILNIMGGKMRGHWKFGCSISVMEDFIASLQPDPDPDGPNGPN